MDECEELPSAYTVQQASDGLWYPLRFGRFRTFPVAALRFRISFARRADAVAYCWNEQRDYERTYPVTPSESR